MLIFKLLSKWRQHKLYARLGHCGKNIYLGVPTRIGNPSNLYMDDYSRILGDANMILYKGKFYYGKYSSSSTRLSVVTDNHTPTVGVPYYFTGSSHINDRTVDVYVREDCWLGTNVTLLPGADVGRGSVVATGALVNKKFPPYAVLAGIPAKIIGVKFPLDKIIEHEKSIYPETERLGADYLQSLFDTVYKDVKVMHYATLSEDNKQVLRKYCADLGFTYPEDGGWRMENVSAFDFIKPSTDNRSAREKIEWSNAWYSNANVHCARRVLLVGDSNMRFVRSTLEQTLGISVDLFATSAGLHDALFLSQLDCFFYSAHTREYTHCFIALGVHNKVSDGGDDLTESDYERFKKDYAGLIMYLQHFCADIVLCSNVLPVVEAPKLFRITLKWVWRLWKRIVGEALDHPKGDIIMRRNKIAKALAADVKLQFCDIHGYIRGKCDSWFPKYIHDDFIHYESRAKKAMASYIAQYVN